jgi:serine/threonine protein kinase
MPRGMPERGLPRGTDASGLLLSDLAVGTRLGEFVIESKLPLRGTGHVYRATHLVLPRRATIRVLPAAEGWMRDVVVEQLREACIVDAVDHPGMPRIFECGMLPDRRPWVASELIEGTSVADLLESLDLTMSQVISIVRDVADILAEAHRRGLVHCHVIPRSIIIPAYARRFPICLVDWVSARTHDSTVPLPLVATGRYTAPEQVDGIAAVERSDVYSLGRIAKDLCECVEEGDVPPMFSAIIDSMLAADRTHRPSSAEVRDVATWLANEQAAMMQAPVPEQLPPQPSSTPITCEDATSIVGEIIERR